jgi:hypothetical protein
VSGCGANYVQIHPIGFTAHAWSKRTSSTIFFIPWFPVAAGRPRPRPRPLEIAKPRPHPSVLILVYSHSTHRRAQLLLNMTRVKAQFEITKFKYLLVVVSVIGRVDTYLVS